MKIKNKALNKTLAGFKQLADKDIPFELALSLAKMITPINEIAEVYNATIRKIYERCARKNDDGVFVDEKGERLPPGRYSFEMNELDAMSSEIEELDETEHDLPELSTINLKPYMKRLEGVDIKPAALVDIMEFIRV